MISNLIEEYRDNLNISYTLKDNNLFSDVGYKVLRNEENSGFIRCVKVSHNGNVKLIYDISRFKTLESLAPEMSSNTFLKVVTKLLRIVIGVKENGFMEYKNISSSLDSIFIDTHNLNVYMIYLPINSKEYRTEESFIKELKYNLVQLINLNRNLKGPSIGILSENLTSIKPLEVILRELTARNKVEERPKVVEKPVEIKVEEEIIEETKKKGFFGKLFSRRKEEKEALDKVKNNDPSLDYDLLMRMQLEREKENNIKREIQMQVKTPVKKEIEEEEKYYKEEPYKEEFYDDYEAETTLLDECEDNSFKSSIILKGLNTPMEVNLLIDKEEFIIGSSSTMVDGQISFNKAISRRHCKFIINGDRYFIQDIGSSNGTFLEGRKLQRNVMVEVKIGDRITLANSDFLITKN